MARKAVWARFQNNFNLATGTIVTQRPLVGLESNIGRTLIDVTVVRIIARVQARSTLDAGDDQAMAHGFIPQPRGILGSGPPAPAQSNDFNDDWMLWDFFSQPLMTYVPIGDELAGNHAFQVEHYDTRSMRKLRSQLELVWKFENISGQTISINAVCQLVVLL